MSEDLIRRSDAIKIMACEMYAEAQSQGYEVDSIEDFMPEAKTWMNDAPSVDTDLSGYSDKLWKNAYERGKADIPQGEWIGEADGYYNGELVYDTWYCSNCDYVVDDEEPPTWNFCPNCGADMRKGADDEASD